VESCRSRFLERTRCGYARCTNITGPDELVFGVEDVAACIQYFIEKLADLAARS
jgi:hypothetical protein